jgi:hypothetical protein
MQLESVHQMFARQGAGWSGAQWLARCMDGGNRVGFLSWHLAATQDWTLRMAIQGRAMIRQEEPWLSHAGINPQLPPFGMELAEADRVAELCSGDEVVAYQRQVHGEALQWLSTLQDDDLDRVPDLEPNSRRLPEHLLTPGYLEEVADMKGWTIARFFSSPAIGHARGHLGELDLMLAQLAGG